jgi:membrane fusion protein, macrolide-specific efflux system
METITIKPKTTTKTIDKSVILPIDKQPEQSTFKKKKKLIIWLIIILIISGAGVLIYNLAFAKTKVNFVTAVVEQGDIENTVVAAGIIQPVKYVDVGAQTSGKVKSLKVKLGDQVKENQLLAEIDPILANTTLTSSYASLENVTSQHSLKEAQLLLAKLQLDRSNLLFSKQVISASENEISQANYDVASAEVTSLKAQMKQSNATVNTARANLGYTKITAPMSGEVVSITALEGQTINANQQAPNLLRIAEMDTVTIWSQVSEADIVRVKLGQEVYFTVLGQTRRWKGSLRQILPTPELVNNVVFYNVLFDIPNTKRELHIQMTAQVFIVLAQAKNVLLIPTSAIGNASEGDEIQIQILKPNENIELRTIKIGIRSEISTEVVSGLKAGETVIVKEITDKSKKKSALNVSKGR